MHWLKLLRRKLRTARGFSVHDWGVFAQAWIWLLRTDWALRVQPFPRVRDWATVDAPGKGASAEEVRRVARLVDCAARHHLYPMRCLRRALVLQRLLWQRGIVTALRLGVAREGDALNAHAWLEREGRPLGEAGDVAQRFAPLAEVKRGFNAETQRRKDAEICGALPVTSN